MMNGAMISGTSNKHKNINISTAEAGSEEAFHASTDVVAMTELMREVGLPQTPEPTTIYCDNTAAILIMENKGAIGKRNKAMDIQIHALRDRRIVDQEVQLEYLGTEEIAADVGTKLLAKEKFEYFRDIIAMIRSSQMKTPFIVKESGEKRTKSMKRKDLS